MSQVVTVSVGRLFSRDERVNTAKLNAMVKSIVINVTGSTGTSDLDNGAVTPAKVSPGAFWYANAVRSGAAYTAAYAPIAVTSYPDGLTLAFKADAANIASPTFDAGNGAKPLYQYGGRTRVEAGDILAGTIVEVRYNTTLVVGGCWEVTSLIGPRPFRSSFQGATAYAGGTLGLVPGPAVGQQNLYLKADGNWADAVADAAAALNALVSSSTEVFKQQNFI